MLNKNYGFVKPVITETHYVEGDGRLLGATIINPSGDWEKSLPKYEAQADKYETYGCTTFGSTNQLETHIKYIYGTEPNYSERYLYNLVNLNPPGADPQNVYEAIRKVGVIPQERLPMPDTLEEFKTPRPMTEELKNEGKGWIVNFFFDHDWVLSGTFNLEKLKTNLKKCPIGVSVTAWTEKDGLYVDDGEENNHWCVLYKIDDKGMYVFDSYDHSKKTLSLTHNVQYAKRIVLYKRNPQEQLDNIKKNFIIILWTYVSTLVKKLHRVGGEIISGVFSLRN